MSSPASEHVAIFASLSIQRLNMATMATRRVKASAATAEAAGRKAAAPTTTRTATPVATTALDVPQKKSAPTTQTSPSSPFHGLEKADQALSSLVHSLVFGAGDFLVFFPAFIFSAFSIPLVLLALYFLLPFATWTRLLLSCLVTLFLTTILKFSIGRFRPAPHVIAARKINLRSLENNHAMPSGDSAQAGVFCVALALAWQQPLILLAIPCTCFGRVFFGCHWIGDTIVGSAMGAMVSLGVTKGMDAACLNPAFSSQVPNFCEK